MQSVALPHSYAPVAAGADLALVHQPEAARAGFTGAGAAVAVIDTGVDWTLPGVGSTFGNCSGGPGTPGCRIVKYATTVTGDPTCVDEIENDPDITDHHGTNVSGVVAQTAPGADLEVFRVFKIVDCAHNTVSAQDGDILTAVNAVALDAPARNIRAVNLSLAIDSADRFTSDCESSPYSAAFLNLRALGVVPTVAAGNGAVDAAGTFQPGVSAPACATGALSVGAVYADPDQLGSHSWASGCTDAHPAVDAISCFSQSGPTLGLLAPGIDITGAGVTESGTSQASPHVAGAVADLASANRGATAAQIVRALRTTGPPITDARSNVTVNRLDIAAAAQAVTAAAAEVTDAGCTTTSLPANDDGSTAVGPPAVRRELLRHEATPRAVREQQRNVTFPSARSPLFTPVPRSAHRRRRSSPRCSRTSTPAARVRAWSPTARRPRWGQPHRILRELGRCRLLRLPRRQGEQLPVCSSSIRADVGSRRLRHHHEHGAVQLGVR